MSMRLVAQLLMICETAALRLHGFPAQMLHGARKGRRIVMAEFELCPPASNGGHPEEV
jgi:hypothetical protein